MGLQEIAIGGIFISPLLLYAILGLMATLVIRTVVHWIVGKRAIWYEAWFDVSLLILTTVGITFLFTVVLES